MNETRSTGRKPDFKGDGVAVWVFEDRNKNKYLSIKITGHDYIKAFKNEPKEVPVTNEPVATPEVDMSNAANLGGL